MGRRLTTLLIAFPAGTALAQDHAIGAKLGSLGLGAENTYALNERLAFRAAISDHSSASTKSGPVSTTSSISFGIPFGQRRFSSVAIAVSTELRRAEERQRSAGRQPPDEQRRDRRHALHAVASRHARRRGWLRRHGPVRGCRLGLVSRLASVRHLARRRLARPRLGTRDATAHWHAARQPCVRAGHCCRIGAA
jgi:hypothetical protein